VATIVEFGYLGMSGTMAFGTLRIPLGFGGMFVCTAGKAATDRVKAAKMNERILVYVTSVETSDRKLNSTIVELLNYLRRDFSTDLIPYPSLRPGGVKDTEKSRVHFHRDISSRRDNMRGSHWRFFERQFQGYSKALLLDCSGFCVSQSSLSTGFIMRVWRIILIEEWVPYLNRGAYNL